MTPDDKPNAPMAPREYVDSIVLPTLHEFLAARDDRRRAYLACLVICHVADSLGLAETSREPGFTALSTNARKRTTDAATKAAQSIALARCGSVFTLVQDMANGTKHPARLPLLPGTEVRVPPFSFGTRGAGFGQGRLGTPGLAVVVDGKRTFIDACAQQLLAVFVCAYPQHLGGIALSSFMSIHLPIPGLALEATWFAAIQAWAIRKPEIAEVWLFGSRAKGTARPDSDVDLGIVLVPGEASHDWPLGNWLSLGGTWRDEVRGMLGRDVSLEAFSRPEEEQSEEEAAARAPAILLWTRPAPTAAGPVSSSPR